jgi:hypothetical protein
VRDGSTYDIGTVIVARFDEQIGDRRTSAPGHHLRPAHGAWHWIDDQNRSPVGPGGTPVRARYGLRRAMFTAHCSALALR